MPTYSSSQETLFKVPGRGAQINTAIPFQVLNYERNINHYADQKVKTKLNPVLAKTIVNKVSSPDVPYEYSINPYQGCEHGCVYCYARNTHPYWGYSAGLDFESKIFYKKNAAHLLRKKFQTKTWQAKTIMLAGNTDCYQPAESKLKITRSLLKVFQRFRHPVALITKNDLLLRDLDILKDLAKDKLVSVAISINGLDDSIRQKLEPRTSTFAKRLEMIRSLKNEGIYTSVLMAPIIPGLNDHEIHATVKAVAEAGAEQINYLVVRLNGDVQPLFKDWLKRHFPDRYQKVINKIQEVHGGQVNDSRFGTRMKGEGVLAELINQQFKQALRKYHNSSISFVHNTALFEKYKKPQLSLF